MTFKRRNHGRCKNHAGRCRPVHCDNCSKLVPADKITRRFTAKQIIDANIAQDVMQACTIEGFELPKQYIKSQYCVNCAIHNHIVHSRNRDERKPKPTTAQTFRRVAVRKMEKKN